MFSVILYAAAAVLTAASLRADRAKTRAALKKAWRSFENILPSLSAILLLAGLILAFLDEDTISALIGAESGLSGVIAAAVVGSAALIPGFVAFPLAASLLRAGAGCAQLAALISALMMVTPRKRVEVSAAAACGADFRADDGRRRDDPA